MLKCKYHFRGGSLMLKYKYCSHGGSLMLKYKYYSHGESLTLKHDCLQRRTSVSVFRVRTVDHVLITSTATPVVVLLAILESTVRLVSRFVFQ